MSNNTENPNYENYFDYEEEYTEDDWYNENYEQYYYYRQNNFIFYINNDEIDIDESVYCPYGYFVFNPSYIINYY